MLIKETNADNFTLGIDDAALIFRQESNNKVTLEIVYKENEDEGAIAPDAFVACSMIGALCMDPDVLSTIKRKWEAAVNETKD